MSWGDIGSLGSAMAAFFSTILALKTIRAAARAADDARTAERDRAEHSESLVASQTANETYNEYLRLCISYPELSSWDLAKKEYGFPSAEFVRKEEVKDTERYLWFVSYMLNACERIILDDPDATEWHPTIYAQLRYHRPILAVMWDSWWSHYRTELRGMIRHVIECGGCALCKPEEK